MDSKVKNALSNLLETIHNIVKPMIENAKYDKTYRAKVVEKLSDRLVVQLNGKNYDVLPSSLDSYVVGQVVKVKAPLNNFSDIYIEEVGSGSGGTLNYNSLINKPSVNSVTLQGNKTLSDLGIQPAGNYVVDPDYVHTDNNYTDNEKNKANGIEMIGFENRTDSTISFNNSTRTFTITGTNFVVYDLITKRLKNTESVVISDVDGLHFIYYENGGGLTESTTFPGMEKPWVATIYWNTAIDKGLLADERHGNIMDWSTHEYLHNTVGTRYHTGLTATFLDSTFSITSGDIYDEDLRFNISSQTTCDVLYKNGSSVYTWLENQTKYYYQSTNIYYNNGNTLTAVPADNYVAYWIFATNNVTRPIVSLMGQRIDTNLNDAKLNNLYESLDLSNLPYREMKLLYRVIVKNSSNPYQDTQDLRSVSNLPSGTYIATDHTTLTNIGVNTHAQIDTKLDDLDLNKVSKFSISAGSGTVRYIKIAEMQLSISNSKNNITLLFSTSGDFGNNKSGQDILQASTRGSVGLRVYSLSTAGQTPTKYYYLSDGVNNKLEIWIGLSTYNYDINVAVLSNTWSTAIPNNLGVLDTQTVLNPSFVQITPVIIASVPTSGSTTSDFKIYDSVNNKIKSLLAGTNVTMSSTDESITINSSGGSGSGVPTGSIFEWPGASGTIPAGYLNCQGQAISRTTYSDLFAIIGTTYGTGDGSTTFNIPDFQARTPVGFSSGHAYFGTFGSKVGASEVTLAIGNLPSHGHTASSNSTGAHTHSATTSWVGDHSHQEAMPNNYGFRVGTGGTIYVTDATDGPYPTYSYHWVGQYTGNAGGHNHTLTTDSQGNHSHTITVNNTGSGTAFSIIQPSLVMYFIIKY